MDDGAKYWVLVADFPAHGLEPADLGSWAAEIAVV